MFRLISILFFLLIGLCSSIRAQNNIHYKKASTIYFKEDNCISRIKISKDTTKAFFRIVHRGMETKEKRKEAIKNDMNQGKPYPVFYTSFSSVSKPETIHSISEFDYITVKEYRKDHYILPSEVIILQKVGNNKYLKWDTTLVQHE